MKRGNNIILRKNVFYIALYLIFLLSFSFLRNSFSVDLNKETANIGSASRVLYAADRSTNFFSNLFTNLGRYFYFKKSLINQIEDLKSQLEIERNQNVLTKEDPNNKNLITVGKKIFSDFTNIYDTILLDKGYIHGVSKGDMVFIYPNKLIGEVGDVDETNSVVDLFSKDKNRIEGVLKTSKAIDIIKNTDNEVVSTSSTSSSTPAILESHVETISGRPSSIIIDVYGYGGGDFIAKIPENILVATGTIIYSAEDESKVVGEVVKTEKQDASFFQILLIKGYYNTRENNDYYIKHK